MTFSTQIVRADNEKATLILAHGAGAGMNSDFMADIAKRLAAQQISVIRFDFPYMQTMTESGKRRPPDKIDKLEAHYLAQIDALRSSVSTPLFIGGKSMGGLVSTLVLEQADVVGAVVYGYPFHPPGKPEKLRTAHLEALSKPLCIIQGERDTFGTCDEVGQYPLSALVETVFLTDGDHSLKPRKASGISYEDNMATALSATVEFINRHLS